MNFIFALVIPLLMMFMIYVVPAILILFITLIHIEPDKPDELYTKMKEINDSQGIIGLSKEQVVELLGKPAKINKSKDADKEVYLYNAGYIFKEID